MSTNVNAVGILAALFVGFLSHQSVAFGETLITPEEAARPMANSEVIGFRALTRAPSIRLISPDATGQPLKTPLNLRLQFQAHGGSVIDPDSIRVTYLREPKVDLTERMRRHIQAQGIDMRDAELPPGDHQLRVEVRDRDGRQSVEVINLTIRP